MSGWSARARSRTADGVALTRGPRASNGPAPTTSAKPDSNLICGLLPPDAASGGQQPEERRAPLRSPAEVVEVMAVR